MKYKHIFLAGALLILTVVSLNANPTGADSASANPTADSLRRCLPNLKNLEKLKACQALCEAVRGDFDEEMKVIDDLLQEAQRQKRIRWEVHARMQRLNAMSNYHVYDRLLKEAPQEIEFFRSNGFKKELYAAQQEIVEIYSFSYKVESAVRAAKSYYEEAQREKDNYGIAISAYALAKVYETAGRHDEVEPWLREAIRRLKAEKEKPFNALHSCYFLLASNMITTKRFQDMPPLVKEWKELVLEIQRLVESGNTVGSLNIYWFYYYAAEASLYAGLGALAKADSSFVLAAANRVPHPLVDGILHDVRHVLYRERGDYKHAIGQLDSCLAAEREGGVMLSVKQALNNRSELYALTGQYKEAYDDLLEAKQINDSLFSVETTARIDDLRTIYEVDRLTAEKELTRLQLIIAIGGCLLLVVTLLLIVRHTVKLRAKNRALYQQIQKQINSEAETNRVIHSVPEEKLSREVLLFRKLDTLVRSEQLFLLPDMDRAGLSERLGTNERYLSDALREAVGLTMPAYFTNLRLQHALQLLGATPDIKLDALALESGYSTYSSFYRAFMKNYGMSPTDYRKLASNEQQTLGEA